MRDPREDTPFESVPSDIPGVQAGILWVHENLLRGDTALTVGTTLSAFLPQAPKGDAFTRGFSSHKFTEFAGKQAGWVGFWFSPVRTRAQEAVAFRTETEWLDMTWPDVLSSLTIDDFEAYDSNGDAYIADTVWETDFKTYRGPTKVVTSYYASHQTFGTAEAWLTSTAYGVGERVLQSGVVYRCLTAHTSGTFATDMAAAKWVDDWALESMQPQPVNFWYGVGNLQIRPSLHPSFSLSWTTGTGNPRYPYQTFADSFAATSPTDWPASLRIANGEAFDKGLYIRRIATAYKPF